MKVGTRIAIFLLAGLAGAFSAAIPLHAQQSPVRLDLRAGRLSFMGAESIPKIRIAIVTQQEHPKPSASKHQER
jgi:hypothetical protein